MEHEFVLQKGKIVSMYTQYAMLRNKVDNDNTEDACQVKTSILTSKIKKGTSSNNNLVYTIENELGVQNGKRESKHRIYSTLKNNVDNNNIEHEFELQNKKKKTLTLF